MGRLKTLIRHTIDKGLSITRGKPVALRIAHEKRRLQRELQAAGHSRKEAMTIISERYRSRGIDEGQRKC